MIVLCKFLYLKWDSRAILSDQLADFKWKVKSLNSLLNLDLSLVSFVFDLECSNDTNCEGMHTILLNYLMYSVLPLNSDRVVEKFRESQLIIMSL